MLLLLLVRGVLLKIEPLRPTHTALNLLHISAHVQYHKTDNEGITHAVVGHSRLLTVQRTIEIATAPEAKILG